MINVKGFKILYYQTPATLYSGHEIVLERFEWRDAEVFLGWEIHRIIASASNSGSWYHGNSFQIKWRVCVLFIDGWVY